MAVWQWTISLVSQGSILEEYSSIPSRISEETLFEIHSKGDWIDTQSCKRFCKSLFGSEQRNRSNNQFWDYGDTKSNDALLEIQDEKILSIGVRLDARDYDRPYVEHLVAFAQEYNFAVP